MPWSSIWKFNLENLIHKWSFLQNFRGTKIAAVTDFGQLTFAILASKLRAEPVKKSK